jgi:hypothetical protein
MRITCDPKREGCGETFEITGTLLTDLRKARELGGEIGCPNSDCKRRLNHEQITGVLEAVEKRLVIDPTTVTGPKSLKAIGGVGVLTRGDLAEIREASKRVAELMADGQWYSADEIKMTAGKDGEPATEGLRRMRELREIQGIGIEKEKIPGTRKWRYRLTRKAQT